MNPTAATTLIAQTFDSKFDDHAFEAFVANLLNHVDRSKAFGHRSGNYIQQKYRGHISTYRRPFIHYDPNGDRLDVLIVRLAKESNLERARTMQRNFAADYLKKDSDETIEAALIAFYHEDVDEWRFSFVRLDYAFGDEGIEEKLTPARRYSFLVGPTEPTHTAETQLQPFLIEDKQNPTIDSLAAAFQIETVSKQFFAEYKDLFLGLVDAVVAVVASDKLLAADFARAQIVVPNFTKKLLGQIVFLYFVQKKGWLGVGVGEKWGSGPKDFLRRLFDKTDGVAYGNFFNDVLEPLFYDALAVRREGDLFTIGGCVCQIPFLNGGLFEPMGGYDWEHTRLLLPNSLFSNRQDAADDSGTGILDVFDRYNFTVWEEEPLEKEVAVDPEMLGKVFENLLEVQDRKSKGAFYTPREIVHYMCQESLINYLDTAVQGEGMPSREEMGVLVRQGALALQQDAAKEAGLKKDEYVLPARVRAQAAALDAALAEIKICDPAIGSGAFPVGMLHEIVQARLALDTQLKQQTTPYHLKRHAIQESIYGVDIDEGAVEIAKLRLWLSLVVDEERYDDIQPLPNLDYKIVRGNSLLGVEKNLLNLHLFNKLDGLKKAFFEETHRQEKLKLKAQIDQLIELLTDGNNTFDFEVYFHEVFTEKTGFDVVIGNPPYGVVFDVFLKGVYEKNYPTFKRNNDLYVAFYELACDILTHDGHMSFISPNTFLNGAYFSALRLILTQKMKIQTIRDFKELPIFDDPTVFVCVFNASRFTTEYPYKVKIEVAKGSIHTFEESWFNVQEMTDKPFKPINLLMDRLSRSEEFCFIDDLFYVKDVGFNYWSKGRGKKRGGSIGSRVFYKGPKNDPQDIPFLKGVNIKRWFLTEPTNFLRYDFDSFLDPNIDTFRFSADFLAKVPKIVYRQTSSTIIAAIDREAHYLNKSVHLIVPKDDWNLISPEMLVGILNSSLYNYLYMYLSQETDGRAFAQVKTIYIKKLPLPRRVRKEASINITSVVTQIITTKQINNKADISSLELELNQLVYQLYGLSPAEIALVEAAVQDG